MKCADDKRIAAIGKSPPARGRGLKSKVPKYSPLLAGVAPCAGAWIEIVEEYARLKGISVAPCAGAWIEMLKENISTEGATGRPLRGGVD